MFDGNPRLRPRNYVIGNYFITIQIHASPAQAPSASRKYITSCSALILNRISTAKIKKTNPYSPHPLLHYTSILSQILEKKVTV